MPLIRAYSRNLGQCSILARKSTFFEKRAPKTLPYSIPFLSVLHRNKALHNFWERGQHSIVKHNIGLEYALLVASNSHISTTSHLLWKNVNEKSYVLAMQMIMPFKVLKYYFSGKISEFFSICLPVVTRSQTGKFFFLSEILTNTTVDFFHKKNNGL